MYKYIFIILFSLVVFSGVCNAETVPLVDVNGFKYSLDVEHYEVIDEFNNYYIYVTAYHIVSKDVCILHIMTDRENNKYIVTDSIAYMHNGIVNHFKDYQVGTYNEESIIGISIKILDGEGDSV